MKSLQGRVPGVFITSNGSPNGDATVRIRGIGTLGDNNPLYIIDGMPSRKSMNEISSMDIESLQVLKDASSASIYGSRAANGVIIITTKKGQKGRTTVNANTSWKIMDYSKPLQWLNTHERGVVQWQAARNDGTNPNFGVYSFNDRQDAAGNWILDEVIIPEFIDDAQTMRSADTDWANEIGRTSIAQNYNVTVSSGNERGRALLSLDYLDSKGTVKGTYFERFSGRVNTDYSMINNRLTIGENLSITKTRNDAVGNQLGGTRNIQPIVPVHTVDGEGWGGPVRGMSDRQNPVRVIEDNKQNYRDMLRLFGDAFINLEIVKNLHIKTMLGMDYTFFWERNMQKTYVSGFMSESLASVSNRFNHYGNWVWSNTINYDFEIAGRHRFHLLAGQEMLRYYSENLTAGRRGFASEDPDYMYLGVGESTITNDGSGTGYALLSYFGNMTYNYDNKYLASFTIRHDGSSRFGANNRFATFPAFSIAWRLSEEPFLKESATFVSDLKFRYTWGQTGNQEISDFASYSLYSATYGTNPTDNVDNGTAYDITGSGSGSLLSGYRRIQQANPNLRWETATQNNFGVDFGFFDQKLTGSFDYFIKKTVDILITPPYIATLGEGGRMSVNGASMDNKGFEVLLSYNETIGNDWHFNVTGNISGYRNKVVKLPEDVINSYPGNGVDQTILGRPRNSIFGYVADGIFQNQQEVDNHAVQTGKGIGRIRYKNVFDSQETGDINTINDRDRTWLGVTDPKFMYGLNFSLTYKQLDFSMFWNGLYGGKLNNDAKQFTDFISMFGGENYGKRTLEAWTPVNTSSTIPMLSANDRNNEQRLSTYYIESSSYFKLRTLEVSYSLPSKISNSLFMQGARIFVLGENLLKFKKSWGDDKYTGVDPETPGSGYPIPFSVTFGISATF